MSDTGTYVCYAPGYSANTTEAAVSVYLLVHTSKFLLYCCAKLCPRRSLTVQDLDTSARLNFSQNNKV